MEWADFKCKKCDWTTRQPASSFVSHVCKDNIDRQCLIVPKSVSNQAKTK